MKRYSGPIPVGVSTTIVFLSTIIALLSLGRTPWCTCGSIKLWQGNIWSPENSQQIMDPYTFTHIAHGIVLYGFLKLVAGKIPIGWRAVIAIALESGWEVFENTDMVIERYRNATISLDYYGDSIINSLGDILAAIVGFFLASRLPTRVTVIGIILLEIMLAMWIRDGLIINIIMLISPIPAIRSWQLGG